MATKFATLTFRLQGLRSMTQDTLAVEVNNCLNKIAAHMSAKLGSATITVDDVVIKQELDGPDKGTTASLQLQDNSQSLSNTGFPGRMVLALAIILEHYYDLTLTAEHCDDLSFLMAGLKVARMIDPDVPEPAFIADQQRKVIGTVELPSVMDFRK